MTRFLEWLSRRLPSKPIGIDQGDGPHFVRYTLVDTPIGSVYLHRFIRADRDRCLHDHPWPFLAIVLTGRYREEVPSNFDSFHLVLVLDRPAGAIRFHRARYAHRIADVDPGTWSLVVVGRKSRRWGFITPGGWVAWEPDRDPICE